MPIHLFAGESSVIFAEVSAALISIGTVVQGAQTQGIEREDLVFGFTVVTIDDVLLFTMAGNIPLC